MLQKYLSDFLALLIMKSAIKLHYLTGLDSWLIHEKFTFLSPTLNKGRLDGKVNLQKWLSGHFLIVKLFVMEFRKKTKGRKQWRQRAAINLQMLLQGSF